MGQGSVTESLESGASLVVSSFLGAPGVCVCVCPPLDQGFRPTDPPTTCTTTDSQAGACDTLLLSHATKLWRRVGRETWPVSCTCDATVDQAVPLSAFCFMILPPNLSFPSRGAAALIVEPSCINLVSTIQLS